MASTASQVVNGIDFAQRSYSHTSNALEIPNLIQVQLDSFNWFKADGLKELLEEVSPIEDFPGGRFELSFLDHHFDEPKTTEEECREREITYSASLHVTVELLTKAPGPAEGERKIQDLFIGDIPIMTSTGTFIINGVERVVVSQLVRSPGLYYATTADPATGRLLASAKLIPTNGAWMEFETSNKDVMSVKVDRKRKSPVSMLLRAMGYSTDQEILELFEDVDVDPDHQYVKTTLEKDTTVSDHEEALLEFYRRLRPGEPPSVENAKTLLDNLFFNPRRYDLGRVGRYKLNRRLGLESPSEDRTLSKEDIINLLRMMIQINNGVHKGDDIDHLGNRRVSGRGRANPEAGTGGDAADGAGHQGAYDHADGPDHDHTRRVDQHQTRGGSRQRVFRRVPAISVHGPDQPAGRADPQASAVGPRTRRIVEGARWLRCSRRPPLPLWADMSH